MTIVNRDHQTECFSDEAGSSHCIKIILILTKFLLVMFREKGEFYISIVNQLPCF
jgi:hypothetical protein